MRGCLLGLVLGCGFQSIQNLSGPLDGGGADFANLDFSVAPGSDLSVAPGSDLSVAPGSDLSVAPGSDLAAAAASDLAVLASGPGPLGALPTGYCCNSDEECRSRVCVTGTSPSYCSDPCESDDVCNVWGAGFACNQTSSTCTPIATPYSCHPAAQYQHGEKAIGSCCAHGFATSGQECLGGLCQTTGNDGNPFYCTQGCDDATPCPGGYDCFIDFCWISQTVGDPNYLYSCQ